MKIKNILGQKFSRLTVLSRLPNKIAWGQTKTQWLCICECKKKVPVLSMCLLAGTVQSCGCLKKPDLTGKKFSYLIVKNRIKQPSHSRDSSQSAYWKCICICGNTKVCKTSELFSRQVRSCGCRSIKRINKRLGITPLSRTDIYKIWHGMKNRCYNSNTIGYKNYGGRGIKVCKRWHKFINFYNDIGERPSPNHSLDRINNNDDYKPSNCKWSTFKEQSNNKRRNIFITYNNRRLSVAQWAKELHIKRHTIYSRLKRGKSKIASLSKPRNYSLTHAT